MTESASWKDPEGERISSISPELFEWKELVAERKEEEISTQGARLAMAEGLCRLSLVVD